MSSFFLFSNEIEKKVNADHGEMQSYLLNGFDLIVS